MANTVRQLCGDGVKVEVIKRTSQSFDQLPKRWIFERSNVIKQYLEFYKTIPIEILRSNIRDENFSIFNSPHFQQPKAYNPMFLS
ncbi:MAG: hypothetical protein MGG37_04230 [Trichodesmium sp. MAG_R01]|nr:hypothetical protein [Trichodesmium sp. MAG_R01]